MNFQEEKILNTIIFFTEKSIDKTIDRLKLLKLILLSDRIHLNKYGRFILKDKYSALPNVPVPSNTFDFTKSSIPNYFDVNGFNLTSLSKFNDTFFLKSDIEVMNFVWDKFNKINSNKLRDFSHKFPEWLRFERDLNDKFMPKSYEIVIEDFFNNNELIDDFENFISKEEINSSKKIFHWHNAIQLQLSN